PPLAQRRPRRRDPYHWCFRDAGELDQHAAERRGGHRLVASLVRGLALKDERGNAQVGRQRRVRERSQIGERLLELAQLEVRARAAERGLPADGRRRRDLTRQVELRSRLVAVALGAIELALGQQHPAAGRWRQ